MNVNNPITKHRQAAIERALTTGDKTIHQIAAEICIHVDGARRHMFLLIELGKVHIKRYVPSSADNNYQIALYRLGAGRNAKKPPQQTSAQRQVTLRKRILADDDKRALRNARRRAKRRIEAATARPSTWASALFGAARVRERVFGSCV